MIARPRNPIRAFYAARRRARGSAIDVMQWAAQQAGPINREQDLSGIRVGLHDEIFHRGRPVLAGVDADSTYCYLLSAEDHRDGDTWGGTCLMPRSRAARPPTRSPMRARACAPDSGQPGVRRPAMA
ncbi:MAG: hypothetical protein VB131_07895, partial [Burkholderia gladioli]